MFNHNKLTVIVVLFLAIMCEGTTICNTSIDEPDALKRRNTSDGEVTLKEINLSTIFAPIYWGFVISLLLGGISIVQGYIYFPDTNDTLVVQITAGAMLVLDIASSALVAQSVYYYLIPHFGSVLPLNSITPELSAECLISTVITLISQIFFVRQLYWVTRSGNRNWLVPAIIILLAILAFAFGIACTSIMVIKSHAVLSTRSVTFQIFFGLAKGFGAVTDIVATVAMCMLLASSRTGMGRSTSIINKLMQFIVHRGALVTLIQTLLLIVFFAAPSHLYWLAFHVNVTKLYVNTFFAMLNARRNLNQDVTRSVDMPLKPQFAESSSSSANFREARATRYEDRKGPTSQGPMITRTVHITRF